VLINQAAAKFLFLGFGRARARWGKTIRWPEGHGGHIVGVLSDIQAQGCAPAGEGPRYSSMNKEDSRGHFPLRLTGQDIPGVVAFRRPHLASHGSFRPAVSAAIFLDDDFARPIPRRPEAGHDVRGIFVAIAHPPYPRWGPFRPWQPLPWAAVNPGKLASAKCLALSHARCGDPAAVASFSIPVLIANLIAWPLAWLLSCTVGCKVFAYRIALSPIYLCRCPFGGSADRLGSTVFSHALPRGPRQFPFTLLRYE